MHHLRNSLAVLREDIEVAGRDAPAHFAANAAPKECILESVYVPLHPASLTPYTSVYTRLDSAFALF
jgi:PHP family Zn ribbon phosphoesterase